MGLDMYLIRKRKTNKQKIESFDWWEAKSEIAYWRKANQVHKWFVDNIQNGNDDCGYYKVTKNQLQDLIDKCKEILHNVELIDGKVLLQDYHVSKNGEREHIKEYGIGKVINNKELCEKTLPVQSGFFFGSTEYDEMYLKDIEYTMHRLQAIIDLLDDEVYDIYYTSSW